MFVASGSTINNDLQDGALQFLSKQVTKEGLAKSFKKIKGNNHVWNCCRVGTLNSLTIVLDGLKLKYRGYDSAGVSLIGRDGKIITTKKRDDYKI